MSRAGGGRSGGKGGLIVGLVIVVLLIAGLGVGGFLWNRSSAMGVAERYMQATMGLFKTGQLDTAALKGILVKDQAAAVEQAGGPLSEIANSPFARALTLLQASYKLGEGEIGFSDATVNATLSVQMGGRTFAVPMKIALAREGLAWKVDGKQTTISWNQIGAPQL
jgi:hypothetical protein